MEVIELKNIKLEEGHIFYFRKYKAQAILKLPTETASSNIEFSIETGPLGNKKVEINLKEQINYPVLPVIIALKKQIIQKENEGLFPKC